jgi:YrbI family 3-deoxy-D-manno-octulosonate 8-phosphate phosphatase
MSGVLAIIPARGGSKGIPRKNLQPFNGRPLVVHTIEQARQASVVTRVVVSTDHDEIAAVATIAGAEVIRRPEEISGDTASSESALLHVLDELHVAEGYAPELVVFLQATSPLRREGEIDRAVATLQRQGADSLFSACRLEGFVWRQDATGLRSLTYDHLRRPRRQEIGADYLENGSIYVLKPWVLRQLGNRLGGKVAIHEMDALDSFQVDEPGDFELMERLLALRLAAERPGLGGIQLLVLDFDGVMTDDRVIVHQDGTESVVCSRSDGMGLGRVRAAGIEVLVLSKEMNPVVGARCRKLGIECHQGCNSKLPKLQELAAARGLRPSEVAYMGNDVNDVECMRWAGVSIAPVDARPEAVAAARWVTRQRGGKGAVREVCEAFKQDKETGKS